MGLGNAMKGWFSFFRKRKDEARSERVRHIPRATFAALPTGFCPCCQMVTRRDLDGMCLICDWPGVTKGEEDGATY